MGIPVRYAIYCGVSGIFLFLIWIMHDYFLLIIKLNSLKVYYIFMMREFNSFYFQPMIILSAYAQMNYGSHVIFLKTSSR